MTIAAVRTATAPPPIDLPKQAPAGWQPPDLKLVPAARASGMVAGAADALRGVRERGNGQSLSDAQVGVIAPFLATEFRLPADQVRKDLSAVRLYHGGPSAGTRGTAVTIGHDLYIPNERSLQRITSWDGRRWLVHELGHTMQWRAADPGSSSDLDRTRKFLGQYGVGAVQGKPQGLVDWAKSKLDRDPKNDKSIGDAVHDAHPMERTVEAAATRFRDATR